MSLEKKFKSTHPINLILNDEIKIKKIYKLKIKKITKKKNIILINIILQ